MCANGSGLTALNPAAQEGNQVAFLQGTSQIAQSFSGFQAGVTYSISLLAAQRGNLNGSGQTFRIDLDSQTIGTFTPSSTNYQTITTANFTATAGAHTLRFVGLDPYSQSSTALLDRIKINVISGPATTNWLVKDHLGTARIVLDQTGALANVKRHDYLPFGEDVPAAFRSSGYGYADEGVRQKFTGYEKDAETGLDFAQARYYANVQGRFTSPDPVHFQAMMAIDPQRFNLYSYGRNNPLKWTDPTGERLFVSGNIQWLIYNVLDPLTGGHFDDYFTIIAGEVVPKGEELIQAFNNGWVNEGIAHVLDLVLSNDNYIFFAGTDGNDAARLFQGSFTTDKNGNEKLTKAGKDVVTEFACGNGRTGGCGTKVGTTGRGQGTSQPANLANGDPVFAVIAYNTNTVQTQTSVDYSRARTPAEEKSLRSAVGWAQDAGVGKVVQPVSFFSHESAENLEFGRQGPGNFDYFAAHNQAMRREGEIRRDLGITGGFAGGAVNTTVRR